MAKLKQQDEAKENEQTQQEPVEIEESQPTVVTRVTDDSETESSENASNDFEIPDEVGDDLLGDRVDQPARPPVLSDAACELSKSFLQFFAVIITRC